MIEQLLVSPDGLRVHLYYWAQDLGSVDGVTVCVPGIPNYPDKAYFKSLPEALRNQAFMVLYYYGYWLSAGTFSVQGTSQSIVDCVEAIRAGGFKDAFTDKQLVSFTGPLSLLSYSFGANPLARATTKLEASTIDSISFVAPLGLVNKTQLTTVNASVIDNFYSYNAQFTQFLARGYEKVIRLENKDELYQYFQGEHPDGLVEVGEGFAEKTTIYYGNKDKMVSRPLLEQFAALFSPQQLRTFEDIGHSKHLITKALLKE